ncbi:MAG: mechanosensitive ion channel domain-containing protein [Planctomycetota bacterium]
MENLLEKLQGFAETYGPKVVAAVLTLVIGWIVAKILVNVVRRVMVKAKVDATLVGFCGNMLYMLLITLVIISAIGKLGVPTASFVAIIGAAGLAVGFALQGSLGNFAAGVMLIMFRPFKAGDYIEAAGTSGVVEVVHVFATTLTTPDNKTVIVPNSAITGGNITNYSAKDKRRVDLVFGIGYGDDMKKAKNIINELLAKDQRILKDPPPTVAVLELADSSVNLAVRPWVPVAEYWNVYFALTEAVKTEFDAQGITIPFPQQDVHMHQVA